MINLDTKPINDYKNLLSDSAKFPLLGYSAVIGVAAGLVASLFRLVLIYMEDWSIEAYSFISGHTILVPPAFILLAVMGYLTGVMLKRYKMAGGSGIPQIKGILMGYFKMGWLSTLIAKFVGGAGAMLAGLSLGREGPSIQLGAAVAQGIGGRLAKSDHEKRILIASGACAGLAAAFNAPLSGVIFTLEEVYKYFSPLILLTAMIAAVISDAVSRLIFGAGAIFNFVVTGSIPISEYWILIVLGIILGLCGALYNKTLLLSLRLFKKIKNDKIRPIPAFLCAGILGLLFPYVICGGHGLMDQLTMTAGIGFLITVLLLKFLFSMISYGSGAPGGIFFPLLVIGATIGAIFARVSIAWFGLDQSLFANIIILAMAGMLTAIVRAPITSIILLVEMTGSFSHLMPLSVVSLLAYVTADLLKSEPVYDSLLHNMLAGQSGVVSDKDGLRRITIETVVHLGSLADNKYVREIPFPENCLLVSVIRHNREYMPHGDTKILAGDSIVVLADITDETSVRETLCGLTSCE